LTLDIEKLDTNKFSIGQKTLNIRLWHSKQETITT